MREGFALATAATDALELIRQATESIPGDISQQTFADIRSHRDTAKTAGNRQFPEFHSTEPASEVGAESTAEIENIVSEIESALIKVASKKRKATASG